MVRGLNRDFLNAMREKLEHGRRRNRDGWDNHWQESSIEHIQGHKGFLFHRLLEEVIELADAVKYSNSEEIRSEAADVANFAMMIADAEGALK